LFSMLCLTTIGQVSFSVPHPFLCDLLVIIQEEFFKVTFPQPPISHCNVQHENEVCLFQE
jgi:hypothetical protein